MPPRTPLDTAPLKSDEPSSSLSSGLPDLWSMAVACQARPPSFSQLSAQLTSGPAAEPKAAEAPVRLSASGARPRQPGHAASAPRPHGEGHRAWLYLFPGEGSLYVNEFYRAQVRSPQEVTLALSVNGSPLRARMGAREERAAAMLITHSEPHTIDASAGPYLSLRVTPRHRSFRRLSAGGTQVLAEGLFDAFGEALGRVRSGELGHAEAHRLFEGLVTAVCDSLAPIAPLDRRVQEVLRHLDDHPEASLGEVAALMEVSPSRASHLFADSFGMSLRNYMQWHRMDRLWELLTAPEQPTLTEIAHRLGFADSSHLTRNFRGLMGYLPSDVRNAALMRVVKA